jgi:ferric-dicitrate binding protein FerR (iron transport regulator)
LISGYLDGELTANEAEKLAGVLGSDAEAVDRLAMGSFIHSQLLDWMSQSHVTYPATIGAAHLATMSDQELSWLGTDPVDTDHDAATDYSTSVTDSATARPRLSSWSALAAVLLVAASVALVTYILTSRTSVVAQLTSANGCEWGGSQAAIPVGSLLTDQQELTLKKGTALVTLVSGTQLLLEAPASCRLAGPNKVHLHNGRIAAKVPTQARGFSVTSTLAQFVDLGTAFTLSLNADQSFQLHVFEGLVELQLDERFGVAAHQPLRVAEVRTVAFDVRSGEITAPVFEVGKKMPF